MSQRNKDEDLWKRTVYRITETMKHYELPRKFKVDLRKINDFVKDVQIVFKCYSRSSRSSSFGNSVQIIDNTCQVNHLLSIQKYLC